MLDAFVKSPLRQDKDPRKLASFSYEEAFSGVVFKIQANMDPAHRDRIAFLGSVPDVSSVECVSNINDWEEKFNYTMP